jgi:hypothetical protein
MTFHDVFAAAAAVLLLGVRKQGGLSKKVTSQRGSP